MSVHERTYLSRSLFGALGHRGVTLLSAVVVTAVLVDRLGAAGYGLWVVLTTVAAFATGVDGGVLGGLSRHVALLKGAGSDEEIPAAIAAGTAVYGLIGVVVTLAAWLFGGSFVRLLDLPPDLEPEQGVVGLVLAAALWSVGNLWQVAAASIEGGDRMPAANGLRAAVDASVAAAMVVGSFVSPTVVTVLASGLVVAVLAVPVAFVLLRRWTGVVPRIDDRLWLWVRREVSFGSRLQIGQLSYLSRDLVDRVVLGSLVGIASVTGYHVAYRVASLTAVLPGVFIASTMPLAARRRGEGREWSAKERDSGGRRLVALSALVVGAASLAYGHLTAAWVGGVSTGTLPVFLLVAMAFLSSNATGVMTIVLRARGELGPEVRGALVAGISNVPLTIWLAREFEVVGIVLASMIATFLANVAYGLTVPDSLRSHVVNQLHVVLRTAAALAPVCALGAVIPVVPAGRPGVAAVGGLLALVGVVLTAVLLRVAGVIDTHDLDQARDYARARHRRGSDATNRGRRSARDDA